MARSLRQPKQLRRKTNCPVVFAVRANHRGFDQFSVVDPVSKLRCECAAAFRTAQIQRDGLLRTCAQGQTVAVGEQIDGSFVLDSETYLLEAKWQGPQTIAADLHAFNGKIEEKAHWTLGLFVSDSGFSVDGLTAFGSSKRIVCMDGLDLHDMLDRGITFHDVITRKVRRAAESGLAFVSVRDLFD